MTGIELIAKERQEQIEKHGRTVEHDADLNSNGELMDAMKALLNHNDGLFPAGWDIVLVQKMCDKPLIERLAIIGAWAAAQIDVFHYLDENPA